MIVALKMASWVTTILVRNNRGQLHIFSHTTFPMSSDARFVHPNFSPEAKISADAPAGGWTTPNLAMAATARAVESDCFIHRVK